MKTLRSIRHAAVGASLSAFFCATACAQAAGAAKPTPAASPTPSGVTLYGILDVGLQVVNRAPDGAPTRSLGSGQLSGSRWGLRGSEGLGGGLKAVFVLESGIDVSNGTLLQGGRIFGRQAYVGLSDAAWGQVSLGRHNSLLIDWSSKHNPFGNANFSAKRVDAAFSDRVDNSLKYVGRFGAVSVGAHYSLGWNNTENADSRIGRLFSAGLRYQTKALDASAVLHRKHADNPKAGASGDHREDRVLLGASYKLGRSTVFGGYRWLEQRLADRSHDSHMAWAGLTYQPGAPLRLSAALYHLRGTVCDDMNVASCPAVQGIGRHQTPTLVVLGAEFDLSRRTTLYALGAYAANDSGSSLSVEGGKFGAKVQPGRDQLGLNLGIRHSF